jgi:bla regulator protein blaR1
MPLTAFTQLVILKAIALAMLHSIWQTALIAALYSCFTIRFKKTQVHYCYYAALGGIYLSAAWFLITIVQQYYQLLHNSTGTATGTAWLQQLNIYLPYLSLLYATTLGWQILRLLYEYLQMTHLQKTVLAKAPPALRLYARQTALRLGIKKEIPVWLSEKVGVPCIAGILKPIILLPAQLSTYLSQSQIEAIVLHELAHIKRWDPLLNLMQLLAEKLLHFNPLLLLLSNQARQYREYCCDDEVLNFKYNANEYATALFLVEKNYRHSIAITQAANGHKKNLLDRIKRVCNTGSTLPFTSRQRYQLWGALSFLVLLMLLTLPAAYLPKTAATHVQTTLATPAKLNSYIELAPTRLPKNEIVKNDEPRPNPPEKNKRIAKKKSATGLPEAGNTVKELAYFDEALLQPTAPSVASAVGYGGYATFPTKSPGKVFVRVEEEHSGTVGKQIYYLQADTNMQMIDIKPLAIITEKKATAKKVKTATVPVTKTKAGRKKQAI